MTEQSKLIVDLSSLMVVGATIIEWLPAVAALFSIVWTCVRLYETKTVQKWLKR
jgi:hypothetical protein